MSNSKLNLTGRRLIVNIGTANDVQMHSHIHTVHIMFFIIHTHVSWFLL